MRLSQLGPLFLVVSFVPFASLPAQQPAPSDSKQMTIHVTVSARNGQPVEGLAKDDFTLSDNKHEQPITELRALTGTRVGVVILLDAINLPYSQVSFARQELAKYFSANAHLAQPTTFGVLQTSGLQMYPGFTTDGNALRAGLDHSSIGLREITRATGLYGDEERLDLSVNTFKRLISQLPTEGMKHVIWISPGWPLLGGPNVELNPSQRAPIFTNIVQLSTELRRLHIVVDAVNPIGSSQDVGQANFYENFLRAPRNPREVELGQLGLQVLALQSGGLVLNGSNDISGLIQRAVAQTNSGYELTFTPAPGERENEYHELQVKVRRPGVAVHTTAGYYARPVFPELPPQVTSPTPN